MENRIELQLMFENILGSRNVYFQPPPSVKIKYPAIVYSLDTIEVDHANNRLYKKIPKYTATLIDTNPSSEYLVKIMNLPYSKFDRFYTSDNLNHFVFTIYNK